MPDSAIKREAGRELVLVHGWGMNASVWEPVLAELEAESAVTRLELPGHGEAPATAMAEGLAGWADQLVTRAPAGAIWVGWSLGGLIAMEAARRHPGRMGQVVVVASTPCFVQRPGWSCAVEPSVFEGFAEALQGDPEGTLKRFLALQAKGVPGARDVVRFLNQAVLERGLPSRPALEAGLAILAESDLRDYLGDESSPGFILGGRDRLVPPEVGDALGGQARVRVLPEAGHAPFVSHPQAFCEQLRSLIDVPAG